MGMDPLLYFFPELKNVTMTSLQSKISVIGLTFLVSLVMFVLSYLGSLLLVDSFRTNLRSKEKIFWCLSIVRAMFGFVASAFGFWFLVCDDTLYQDVVSANNYTSFFAVYICVGFFIFECGALFSSNIYFRSFDGFLALHHGLSLVGYSVVTYYNGKAHFFAASGLLEEVTTPFSCFCWMLLKSKMAHLSVWKFNQLILVHLFHCRTTLEGFYYVISAYNWGNILENMPIPIFIMLYTQLSLQFFILTPYWTYKKMMQLVKPVDWNHPELDRSTKTVPNGTIAFNKVPLTPPQSPPTPTEAAVVENSTPNGYVKTDSSAKSNRYPKSRKSNGQAKSARKRK